MLKVKKSKSEDIDGMSMKPAQLIVLTMGYKGRSSDLRFTKFETFDIRIACLEKAI